MAKKCPNCNDANPESLGKCTSKECHSGNDGVIFCDECYNDHLISAHDRFDKID